LHAVPRLSGRVLCPMLLARDNFLLSDGHGGKGDLETLINRVFRPDVTLRIA
jgi:hypothetical protein